MSPRRHEHCGTGRTFGRVCALFAALGWVSVGRADIPVELEVLGELAISVETERQDNGERTLRGRLNDEVGKPVAGVVTLWSSSGVQTTFYDCDGPLVGDPRAGGNSRLEVGPTGDFCLRTPHEGSLVLEATATHFVTARHDLDLSVGRQLSAPRFVRAPQTIEHSAPLNQVVEVLGQPDPEVPVDARLSLSMTCDESDLRIDEVTITGNHLARFEFDVPDHLPPGNCQFVATATAPSLRSVQASRTVLLRDVVTLRVADTRLKGGAILLTVSAQGTAGHFKKHPLNDGLVEAQEKGAFLALGPVKNGTAELELAALEDEREITLIYVPSTPALVSAGPLHVVLPSRAPGFHWATVHTVALFAFGLWLLYAWLRPQRSRQPLVEAPAPRETTLQESGRRKGPIGGKVLDSHTGGALSDTVVVLLSISPESRTEIERVETDERGFFQLKSEVGAAPVLEIEATNEHHMTLRSPLRSSEVTVHLTQRRRAVIQNFIAWARTLGAPWHGTIAPTPGSVELIARERALIETESWAKRVAAAAYAPEPPNEEAVDALRTPGGSPLPVHPAKIV